VSENSKASSTPARRPATLRARLLLAFGSVIVIIGGIEGALSFAGYGKTPKLYFDESIGPRFYPHCRVKALAGGAVSAETTLNEWGLRGPSFEAEPAPGVTRIVCLGDSFTMGWGVADDETYPIALQAWLDENAAGSSCEVLNVGTSDHNTVNERRVYEQIVRGWKPDVVVLGHVPNDVQPETLGIGGRISRFEFWLQSTAIASFLRLKLKRGGQFHAALGVENRRNRKAYAEHRETIVSDPEDRIAAPFWKVSLDALAGLVDATRMDGVPIVIVRFPARSHLVAIEAAGRAGPRNRRELRRSGQLAEARLRAEASRLGAPYVDLSPEFRRLGSGRAFGPIDLGHPSAGGHRAAAQRIGAALLQLGIVRGDE